MANTKPVFDCIVYLALYSASSDQIIYWGIKKIKILKL